MLVPTNGKETINKNPNKNGRMALNNFMVSFFILLLVVTCILLLIKFVHRLTILIRNVLMSILKRFQLVFKFFSTCIQIIFNLVHPAFFELNIVSRLSLISCRIYNTHRISTNISIEIRIPTFRLNIFFCLLNIHPINTFTATQSEESQNSSHSSPQVHFYRRSNVCIKKELKQLHLTIDWRRKRK